MPITFTFCADSRTPVDASSLTPGRIDGLTIDEVRNLPIGLGNRTAAVRDCFDVSGEVSDSIVFAGDLDSVHHIGQGLDSGLVEVHGNAGRHVGDSMVGGELIVRGNVSDFAGYEMRGGTLVVHGDVGDQLGGCYPGAKFGMNRGTILVAGDAGKGVGYRMRRGMIVVAGNAGAHVGWQMRAGTIAVLGKAESPIGVDMKRGTIMLNRFDDSSDVDLGETFRKGMSGSFPIVSMLRKRIRLLLEHYEISSVVDEGHVETQIWHGDELAGSRGEVFMKNHR